jgi:hypothetical protein
LGFERDLSAILELLGKRSQARQRQTVLTSATLHDRVLYGTSPPLSLSLSLSLVLNKLLTGSATVSQASMTKPLYVGFDETAAGRAFEEVH